MKLSKSNVDMFKFACWAGAIWNGGQAISGVVTGGYLYGGLSMGIGITWIGIIEFRKRMGA